MEGILADNSLVQELIKSLLGPEPNSYFFSYTRMIERGFTKKELISLFALLKIIYLKPKTENTSNLYKRVYYLGLITRL